MLSILSNSEKFFYLIDSNSRFSFESKNFLHDSFDVSFKFSLKNKFRRGVGNNLLSVNKMQKFEIELRGFGFIPSLPIQQYSFISSMLVLPYEKENIRKIAFDYLFKNGYVPSCNVSSNIDQVEQSSHLFFMPEIVCVVKSQKIKNSHWVLKLEEV